MVQIELTKDEGMILAYMLGLALGTAVELNSKGMMLLVEKIMKQLNAEGVKKQG